MADDVITTEQYIGSWIFLVYLWLAHRSVTVKENKEIDKNLQWKKEEKTTCEGNSWQIELIILPSVDRPKENKSTKIITKFQLPQCWVGRVVCKLYTEIDKL